MNFHLSPLETDEANAFLMKPEVRAALYNGGRVALVFGPATGIGMPVEITVMGKDGQIFRKDITDVGCW